MTVTLAAGGTRGRIERSDTDTPDRLVLAPLNVALMEFLDREYDTDFGVLTAARDVRG